MTEKDYKKRTIIGIVCNIVSLFILGYVFSGIAYSQFNKNYNVFLEDYDKRIKSLWGKVVSVFFFTMSCSYHGQSLQEPLNDRIIVSCIIGVIFSTVAYFSFNSKDKKLSIQKEYNKQNEKLIIEESDNEIKEKDELNKSLLEKNKKIESADSLIASKSGKNRYCKMCGGKIDEDKKCKKCGKQYFKFNSTILLFIIICILTATNLATVILYSNTKKDLDYNINRVKKLEDDITVYDTRLDILTGNYTWLYTSNKIDFFDENIVFVIKGYGDYYYSYDCMMNIVDGDYSYWAYNKEAAISRGYKEGSCY